MYFVAGITGHVGGAAARRLLAQGEKVRALVRDTAKAAAWKDQGVEVRQGDFNDAETVAAALDGVEGAFLMLPPVMTPQPGFPEARKTIDSLVAALRKAPPVKLVVLSSIGSEQSSGLGLITGTYLLEQALAEFDFPIAFIRAGAFLENNLGGLGPAQATGVFYTFAQDTAAKRASIATEDIGAEVAKLLGEDWTGQRVIELGSDLSAEDLAAAMGEALGRDVKAQSIPRERWAATFESFGMPPGSSWAYEEMLEGIESGWIHMGVPGTERVEGKTPAVGVFRKTKV